MKNKYSSAWSQLHCVYINRNFVLDISFCALLYTHCDVNLTGLGNGIHYNAINKYVLQQQQIIIPDRYKWALHYWKKQANNATAPTTKSAENVNRNQSIRIVAQINIIRILVLERYQMMIKSNKEALMEMKNNFTILSICLLPACYFHQKDKKNLLSGIKYMSLRIPLGVCMSHHK